MKNGFTLIELLVVIAILGILSAAVLVGINPLQKINKSNDSKVKSDIGQMAIALHSYYVSHLYFPSSLSDLVTAKELTSVPVAPSGYTTYTISVSPAGCTTLAANCTNIAISGQLKVPLIPSNTLWCYKTSTGIPVEGTACAAP